MIVSLLGLVISLFAYLIAFPDERTRRFDVYAALLSLHIIACIGFWLMSFESAMDAFLYYRDPFGFIKEDPFSSGTFFVVHFVQGMRSWLGGSFLDHFLFFQCFGMIAMALLIRSLNEVALSLNISVPLHVYLILFLPGLHFWTAGIGKDGPMLMAICLAGWSALRIEKRFVWMAVALAVMACVRPHITPMVMAGAVAGLLLTKQVSARVRLILAPVVGVASVILIARATESLNLTLDAESLSTFVEQQQGNEERFGSGTELSSLPLPLKIFSLMFRPLFLDAEGMTGIAASVENAALLYFCLYISYHWKMLLKLARTVFFVIYFLVFDGALILSLSLVNYNIGLGQRMKMMAVPGILLIYGTIFMYKRALAAHALQVAAQPPPEHQAEPAQAQPQPL
jgi:hypothetical protein